MSKKVRDPQMIAMMTAYLMAGSHPDVIHPAHVPRMMDLAEAIVDEAEKRNQPAPEPKPTE